MTKLFKCVIPSTNIRLCKISPLRDLDPSNLPKIVLKLCSGAVRLDFPLSRALWSAGCLPLDAERCCPAQQAELGMGVSTSLPATAAHHRPAAGHSHPGWTNQGARVRPISG